jgi:peptidoglycan hydrolase-like protein with peptidoglycan-binding domain
MKGAIMKTSNKVSLAVISTLLAGTCFAVAPAWSQGDSRLRQGAPVGSPLNPGTPNPDRIKKTQQALKDKGFYSGPIDGVMGQKTRDAIRSFQKANNLHVTAAESMDDETRRALGIDQ